MIKVLVVEDSPVVQEFLLHIFGADPEIRVIGVATNGEEAVAAAAEQRPDVITMDINMPKMDGIEATRRIMETTPVPIVIVSGNWNPKEVETTFKAMEAGAISIVQRPAGIGHPEHRKTANDLLQTVKLMSEVKVVRRWQRYRQAPAAKERKPIAGKPAEIKVIAMGASTGGPVAIQTILSLLPKGFQTPILVVQHIAKGFLQGMLDWLKETSAVAVRMAVHGERVKPGHAYFAPDGSNMGIGGNGEIYLSDSGQGDRVRPSASFLFRSVAESYGENAIGVLLTGMGSDGAEELKLMRSKGAITIAQDKASSVIFGMPGTALALDAATYMLPPNEIADSLKTLTGVK